MIAGFSCIITFEFKVVSATTIYVGSGAGNDSATINGGIALAGDGDTVFVYSGIYTENVAVIKTINLTGENRDNTIIDGGGSGNVVSISADWVNISGFSITNGLFDGILITSSNNTIGHNNIFDNLEGVKLDSSSNNHITGNNISFNTNNKGIRLETSSNNTIENNIVSNNNGMGIRFSFSNENNIINNTIHSNLYNGIQLVYSPSNMIANNTFSNNGYNGIEISNFSPNNIVTGNTVFSNLIHGIDIYFYSNGTYITGNNVTNNNEDGIELSMSSNGIITGNTIYLNNVHGIHLLAASNITISNNNVSSNNETGILLDVSTKNSIMNNNVFLNNGTGIKLHSSDARNIIINNNVFSNKGSGILDYYSNGNNIMENSVRNNLESGIVLDNSSSNMILNNTVSNNVHGGILFCYSGGNSIKNNTCNSNILGAGIEMRYSSSGNMIANNTCSDNMREGININNLSSNNDITDNTISSNDLYGLIIEYSGYNNIINNLFFLNSLYAIDIRNEGNNTIYHNQFVSNNKGGIQAGDNTGANNWNYSYPIGGNYWSDFDEPDDGAYDDYQGQDQNISGSDGIIDNGTIGGGGKNPYVIDADCQDYYPLTGPISNYTFLYEGWNLISIPLIQPDTDLDAVLSSISGSYDAVQMYDITESSDPWKLYYISKPPLWNDLIEIDHKIGFWIHITKPGGVIFECPGARPIVNQTITLFTGWNLVGYPSLIRYNRTSGLNNIKFGSDVDCIQWYDAAAKAWHFMGMNDSFVRGMGYWVHSKVDKTWDVPL